MQPGSRNNLLVVGSHRGTTSQRYETAFHEYVHYVFRNATSFQYPTWYDEGLADLLSTIRGIEGGVSVGEVPASRAYAYRQYEPMPLREILTVQSTSALAREDRARFYAGSWLFAHYLQMNAGSEDGARRARQSLDYLGRIDQGRDRLAAFVEAFDMPVAEMDAALRTYAGGKLTALMLPDSMFDYNDEFTRRRLSRNEIAYALGHAVLEFHPEEAARFFGGNVKRAPDDVRSWAALGVALAKQGKLDEARAAVDVATAADLQDPIVHLDIAGFLRVSCEGRSELPACAPSELNRKMLEAVERAHELAPELFEVNYQLGVLRLQLRDGERAVEALERARSFLPSHYGATKILGVAYWQVRDYERAERYLTRALGWSADNQAENLNVRSLLQQLAMAKQLSR